MSVWRQPHHIQPKRTQGFADSPTFNTGMILMSSIGSARWWPLRPGNRKPATCNLPSHKRNEDTYKLCVITVSLICDWPLIRIWLNCLFQQNVLPHKGCEDAIAAVLHRKSSSFSKAEQPNYLLLFGIKQKMASHTCAQYIMMWLFLCEVVGKRGLESQYLSLHMLYHISYTVGIKGEHLPLCEVEDTII